jgi:hypothetical protein
MPMHRRLTRWSLISQRHRMQEQVEQRSYLGRGQRSARCSFKQGPFRQIYKPFQLLIVPWCAAQLPVKDRRVMGWGRLSRRASTV